MTDGSLFFVSTSLFLYGVLIALGLAESGRRDLRIYGFEYWLVSKMTRMGLWKLAAAVLVGTAALLCAVQAYRIAIGLPMLRILP